MQLDSHLDWLLRDIEVKFDCKTKRIWGLSGQVPDRGAGGFLKGIPRENHRVWMSLFPWMGQGRGVAATCSQECL